MQALVSPYLEPVQPRFTLSVLGALELVTAPSGRLVTIDEAKAQCRVFIADDNDYLNGLIDDATELVEREVCGHRQLISATYNLPIACWADRIALPRPPLQSVDSVTYYDGNGDQQTVSTSSYLACTPWRQPGVIERAPNQVWPSHQWDRARPIYIQFTAGYGPVTSVAGTIAAGSQTVMPASMYGIYAGTRLVVGSDRIKVASVTSTTFTATFAEAHGAGAAVLPAVPRSLKRAILLLVAHWYRNAEAVGTEAAREVPLAFRSLIEAEGWGSYG